MAVTATAKSNQRRALESWLARWDARLRLLHSLTWFPRGLAGGLIAGLLLSIAARLWPLLPQQVVLLIVIGLAVIGIVIALVAVWLWARSPIQKARRFDRVFDLKERMSTALEVMDGTLTPESEDLARYQLDQALNRAGLVNPSESLPIRLNWRDWVAPVAVGALIVVALILPNPQESVIDDRIAVQSAIDRQVEELRDLREEVLADETLSAEDQASVIETLDQAIQTLEQPGISQQEAVAALQAAEQDLRDISQQNAAEQQQALEQASGRLDGTAAQDAADALAQGDTAAAAAALQNLNLDNLSAEEQQQLAEALQQAAEDLQGTNPDASQALSDAAGALQQGDTSGAQQSLGEAGQAMQQGGQGGQSTQQVEEYADKVRKGQASVAQSGQGQGNQPGQGGMGQAQQGGQGQGQNGENGSPGSSGGGAGRGESQGEAQGGPAGQMDTDNGPGDGGETAFGDIYSPQRIGGEGGDQVDIPGNPGAGLPTGSEGNFAENPQGDSTVPYNDVYGDYAGAVNEALDNGYVPLGLRGLIQQYFTRLDPTENR